MLWIDLAILLACILIGARLGGIGLGAVAALGMALLVFGFGRMPGSFPGEVLIIVLCVVTAAAALQAAGGLDLMVSLAEKLLRRHPQRITILAPLISYVFTFVCGTGHVSYSLLPIIAEVSRKVGERPERPMSISVIASQFAVTASPLSAATAAMVALFVREGSFGLKDVLIICVPSTLIGLMAGAISVLRKGVALDKDPVYMKRLEEGQIPSDPDCVGGTTVAPPGAKWAVALFVGAAVVITLLGLLPGLRPQFTVNSSTENLSMVDSIALVTLSATALILVVSKVKPEAVVSTPVMRSGVVAIICILGIAWLGSTFFEGHREQILGAISGYLMRHSWLFSAALFLLSILLYSQAATVAALMGVGLQLGIAPPLLIAMFPACNGFFFLPTYATMVAAIQFDRTGTTGVGRLVLNHSFMRPGLVTTIVSLAAGLTIARIFYGV
jgi:anaerobic C4-dicarboxylate transporter DcuA